MASRRQAVPLSRDFKFNFNFYKASPLSGLPFPSCARTFGGVFDRAADF
jgi:hypothetical protein